MKGGLRTSGFTIIETMIVLAVTGAIFVSAVLAMNGKQASAEFNESIRDVQTRVQQTINEVRTGYYPNNGSFTCSNTMNMPSFINSPSAIGTNSGCIFIGKVIQFAVEPAGSAERANVYTVAGIRTSSGKVVTELAEAIPTLVDASTTSPDSVNLTQPFYLKYGLRVSKMYYDGNQANQIGAVAFMNTLGEYDDTGANLASGSQRLNVTPIPNSHLHQTSNDAASTIQQKLRAGAMQASQNPAGGVQICFDSGSTHQSGLLSIGGSSNDYTVDMTIKDQEGC